MLQTWPEDPQAPCLLKWLFHTSHTQHNWHVLTLQKDILGDHLDPWQRDAEAEVLLVVAQLIAGF